MKGSRPEQAALSRDTDMTRTDETRRIIEGMVDGLNDHRIDDIGGFFAGGFRWIGDDCCAGRGWEAHDRGEKTPPRPKAA